MDEKELGEMREELLEELLPLITPERKMGFAVDTEGLKKCLKKIYPKDTEIDVELTDDMDIEVHCKIPMSYRQITIDEEKLKRITLNEE